jgi:hypothetical protein
MGNLRKAHAISDGRVATLCPPAPACGEVVADFCPSTVGLTERGSLPMVLTRLEAAGHQSQELEEVS